MNILVENIAKIHTPDSISRTISRTHTSTPETEQRLSSKLAALPSAQRFDRSKSVPPPITVRLSRQPLYRTAWESRVYPAVKCGPVDGDACPREGELYFHQELACDRDIVYESVISGPEAAAKPIRCGRPASCSSAAYSPPLVKSSSLPKVYRCCAVNGSLDY